MKRIIFTSEFKEIDSKEGWRYLYILPNIVIINHKTKVLPIRFLWIFFHIDILLKGEKHNER